MVMVNVFWEGVNANQATEEMTAVKVRRTFFTSKVIVAISAKSSDGNARALCFQPSAPQADT